MSIWIPDGSRVRPHHAFQTHLDAVLAKPQEHPPGTTVIQFGGDYDGDVAVHIGYREQLYARAMGRRSPFFKHTRKQRGRK